MDHAIGLDRLLVHLPDPTVLMDVAGTILWANDAAVDFCGFDPQTRAGISVFDVLHPDDHATVVHGFTTIAGAIDDIGDLIDVRVRDTRGRWLPCEVRGRFLEFHGQGYVVIVIRSIADRHRLELGAGSHERLRAQVHHAHVILASLDAQTIVRSINAEVARTLGIDSAHLIGRPFDDVLVPADQAHFRDTLATMGDTAHFAARAERMDGTTVHLDLQVADLRDDALQQGYTLCATDVSDLENTQRALRHMADHDALTGLLSRRALLTRLDSMVQDGYQHEIVMLFCDLDGFKPINDRLGHAAGDHVLIEVARRLERSVRPGDLLGRLGGDEFVVVLPKSTTDDAHHVSASIRAEVTRPIATADRMVEVDVSIGVATSGTAPTVARLLAAADDAMYAVKETRSSSRLISTPLASDWDTWRSRSHET